MWILGLILKTPELPFNQIVLAALNPTKPELKQWQIDKNMFGFFSFFQDRGSFWKALTNNLQYFVI